MNATISEDHSDLMTELSDEATFNEIKNPIKLFITTPKQVLDKYKSPSIKPIELVSPKYTDQIQSLNLFTPFKERFQPENSSAFLQRGQAKIRDSSVCPKKVMHFRLRV